MGLKNSAKLSVPTSARTLVATGSLLSLFACAHVPTTASSSGAANGASAAESAQTQSQITKLQEKISDLEVRLSALNDKINLENGAASPTSAAPGSPNSIDPLPTAVVESPAAENRVIPKVSGGKKSKTNFSAVENFSNSEAIDRFREAKILYDSKRYSDAVLEFSNFVKNEPEHPLAAGAQYFVGMSYLKQKEYKLSEEELSRGLLAYAHSSYIPDTLLALTEVSGLLHKAPKVTYYREKLLSHFPNSPQAKRLNELRTETASAAPVQTAPMQTEAEPSVISPKGIERPEVPTVSAPALEGDRE